MLFPTLSSRRQERSDCLIHTDKPMDPRKAYSANCPMNYGASQRLETDLRVKMRKAVTYNSYLLLTHNTPIYRY